MYKIITLAIILALVACSTTQAPPSNSAITTHKEQNNIPIAGAPTRSATTPVPARIMPAISTEFGQRISAAYNYLQPTEGEPQPDKSLEILKSIPANNLNDYEIALISELKGYAYVAKEDYTRAIEQFNLLLSKNQTIPLRTEVTTLKFLYQLYYAIGNYEQGLTTIYKWSEYAGTPSSVDFYQISIMQEKTGDLINAQKNIETSIQLANKKSGIAPKRYYELQADLYTRNNEPEKANEVREKISSLQEDTRNQELIPIMKVAQEYPSAAVRKKIQGYCIVTFTVNITGRVENAHVNPGDCKTDQGEPTDVFTASSITAVSKYRYAPKIEKGVPVEVKDVKNKIVFALSP